LPKEPPGRIALLVLGIETVGTDDPDVDRRRQAVGFLPVILQLEVEFRLALAMMEAWNAMFGSWPV
jgi:hypothetical protein